MALLRSYVGRLLTARTFTVVGSMEEARSRGGGYDDVRVAELVAGKTERHRGLLLTGPPMPSGTSVENTLAIHLLGRGDPVEVLELGGACGAACFEARSWLPAGVRRWHVVETPTMVEAAARFADESLAFFTDVDEAAAGLGDAAIGVLSGCLQYMDDPYGVLDQVGGSSAGLFVARTPLVMAGDLPLYLRQRTRLVDHGPGRARNDVEDCDIYLSMMVLPHAEFVEHLSARGEIVASFDEGERFTIDGREIRNHGFAMVIDT